jgi:WD40 repeat protein
VTPDGRHVVSSSLGEATEVDGFAGKRVLRAWDLATGETETLFRGAHTSPVTAVAVTPDGRHMISGSHDHTLRVWDLATGQTKKTLLGHTGSVAAVAVTPDGRQVVSGSRDRTLRVWDLAPGETKTPL